MASNSLGEFEGLLGSVDQLITIHRQLRQGPGRRYEQDAIHRAGVVLAVAAWQAYIEKVFQEGLQHIENHVNAPAAGVAPPAWATVTFLMRRASINKSISEFNTPTRRMFSASSKNSLEFDPWPSWTWHVRRRNWTSQTFRNRTDDWLKIRHSIAHGFQLPNNMNWIQVANGAPRLTLGLLQECRKHFHFLARRTDQAFSNYLAPAMECLHLGSCPRFSPRPAGRMSAG